MTDAEIFAMIVGSVLATAAGMTAIVLGGRVLWRLGSRAGKEDSARPAVTRADLERLEIAIEAIAIEVERISEAQRFTATLLSERLPERTAERPARLLDGGLQLPRSKVDTPH